MISEGTRREGSRACSMLFLTHPTSNLNEHTLPCPTMIVPTLLALLVVINLYGFVMADHFRCYWKYVAGAPTNSGFSRHCLAEKKKVDDMHARYECLESQMVADWGYLDT